MKDIEIRQQAIALHNDLRIVKMQEKYKALFLSVMLLDNMQKLEKEKYEKLREQAMLVIEDSIQGWAGKRIAQKFLEACLSSAINDKVSEDEYSLWWFIHKVQTVYITLNNDQKSDAVNIFYHMLLSYSSGDRNALGIVLTPDHIADFMARSINIHPGDTVIDICCGTGALLNAASIYNKGASLYGCEQNEDVFDMSVIGQTIKNTKAHLFNDDCFNLRKKNIKLTADKGLLNPPYSQRDYTELEFFMEELEMIKKGGIAAVICPKKNAYCTNEPYTSLKRKLLSKHTLKAVFSMPDDLFKGNGASTVTCIMIFQAHVPHDPATRVFFGFYKNDGFKKRGKLGRVDEYNNWGSLEQKWLDLYHNMIILPGLSAIAKVGPEDEWLCEAYIRNDYNKLTEKNFEKTIRDYMAYCLTS